MEKQTRGGEIPLLQIGHSDYIRMMLEIQHQLWVDYINTIKTTNNVQESKTPENFNQRKQKLSRGENRTKGAQDSKQQGTD